MHVLVRPRAGSFVYTADELDVQVRDVRAAVRAGAAGVVVGALTAATARWTADAVARLVEAADGREVTFHRAFDTSRRPGCRPSTSSCRSASCAC